MEDRHGIAELRGCPLAYTIRGNGPPVLFIQGVGVHGDGWLPQIEQMSATYSCVSFDNRGMGRSQPAGAAITVEQMAADAEAVLQTAQIERAHVVGHSLGGLVALQLALALRQRVVSLSLLCTFALGRAAAPLSARMFWLGLRSRVGTRRMRREAFLRLILPPGVAGGPDVTAEQLAAIFGHDLADQPPVVSAQLRAMRQADATARLGALASPTLVVSAAHDPIAPPALGRALAAAIRGAEYVEFATPRTGCRSRTRGTSTRCCSGTCSRRRPPPWQPERLGHPTSRADHWWPFPPPLKAGAPHASVRIECAVRARWPSAAPRVSSNATRTCRRQSGQPLGSSPTCPAASGLHPRRIGASP